MKTLLYKGIPCVLARTWKEQLQVELVSTLTGECFRVHEQDLRSQELVHAITEQELSTLPRECGFIPFPERPREFITELQLRRQQVLLEYSKKAHRRRRSDFTSDDSDSGWADPVSKAPRTKSSGTRAPRGKKAQVEIKLSAARQKLLQKGLGDLFD